MISTDDYCCLLMRLDKILSYTVIEQNHVRGDLGMQGGWEVLWSCMMCVCAVLSFMCGSQEEKRMKILLNNEQ